MTDRLYAAARRSLDAIDDLIANTYDPGVEALGARYELATALMAISPNELPLDETGFDPRADLNKVVRIVWSWIAAVNDGLGADTGDLADDLENAGFPAPRDEPTPA